MPNQTGAEPLPATDTLWRDVYHVIEPLPGEGGAQLWRAHRTDTAQEVVLRVAPGVENDPRSAALSRLGTVELVHLQRVRDRHFVGGQRVEISDAIRGVPLDVWRRERSAVDLATVETVVRQIAEALGVLHATGLVHLGLKPGAVFVREENGGLHCTLGGLEAVTFFDASQPIPMAVDPRYAPPEAAALERHEPGRRLCAWDWWGLGRVVQEFLLGHHVIDDVPGADRSLPAESRMEALLLEPSAKGMRAGAVETMLKLDPRLQLLLRGLLASDPEVRWNGDAVDRWTKQLPVKEHYTTLRVEKKFRWRGRLWSVPDAAKELQTAERWSEAVTQIFDAGVPGTLANFISKSPEQKNLAPHLAETRKLIACEPLAALAPTVAREIVTTVALVQLAAGNLIWRGRRLDGESLGAIVAEKPDDAERFAFARALVHRTITAELDRHDFAASRSIGQIARSAADAEAIIRRQGWLKGPDDGASEQIFRLALAPEAALLAARQRLQRDFACAIPPAIDKMFKVAKPSRVELIVLAWAESEAAQRGFITHLDWEVQQLKLLQERGGPIAAGLFWARLGRALAAGPAIFGVWPAVAVGWGGAALAIEFVFPGAKWLGAALAPVALAIGARLFVSLGLATTVRRVAPAARPWTWRDGAKRCEVETVAAGKGLDAAGLERALAEINSEIAKLKRLSPAPEALQTPAKFGGVRGAASASWVLIGGVLLACGWRGKVHPPSWTALEIAWFPSQAAQILAAAKSDATGAAQISAKPIAPDDAPVADAIKVSWPYHATDDFETLNPVETIEPTKAQLAYAMQRGRTIAAPYRTETINSFVLFEVPAGEKIGVVVFDCAHASLVLPRVFILATRPPARAWVELSARKAVVVPE